MAHDSPPAQPGARRAPDFFIVGQPKSGTTALYEMLRSHPQLYMPALKEPLFLANDLLAGLRWPTVRARPRTLDDYLSLFAAAAPGQRTGEASALYLCSHEAAVNIAKLAPAARIIAILREPVSLVRSLHLQLLQDHSETESDLSAALSLEGERRDGKHIPRECARPAALYYSEHTRYVEQLRRYHDVFSSDQVLVVIYDDFRADNAATLQTVLRFLEVEDASPAGPVDANPTVRLRSRQLDEIVKNVASGRGTVMRAVKAPVKTLTPRRVRRGALGVARRHLIYGQPRPLDPAVALDLRRRYKPEVLALGEYLGRDLVSLWGYDSLD
jgi:hypothetical protein